MMINREEKKQQLLFFFASFIISIIIDDTIAAMYTFKLKIIDKSTAKLASTSPLPIKYEIGQIIYSNTHIRSIFNVVFSKKLIC